MTAHAFREDIQRCLACGMDDYLAKPLKPTQLYETVSRWLTHVHAEAEPDKAVLASHLAIPERATTDILHPSPPPSQPDTASPTGQRFPLGHPQYLESILPRFGHETAFFIEMFEAFVEQTAQKVKELRQAAQKNDAAAIRFLAHNLKGVAANFEAANLVTYCTQLEQMRAKTTSKAHLL